VDVLLTARRDRKAALRFLPKTIRHNAMPEEITIAKISGNTAAIGSHNGEHKAGIEILQVKYFASSLFRVG
jgi:transposase-like protein